MDQQLRIGTEGDDRQGSHPLCWKKDLAWVLVIGLVGVAVSLGLQRQLHPALYDRQTQDTWFDADISRVAGNMTSRTSSHFRISVHPLFSLLTYPGTTLIGNVAGISSQSAVKIVVALMAASVLSLFFVILRLLDCRGLDAMVFTLLLVASASSIFWLGLPDTFLFGSVTILGALCVCAVAAKRRLSEYWYIAISVLTLSCTTTNWLTGIAATFAHHRWRRAVQVTVNAFFVVVVLWGIENAIFNQVTFFFVLRSESAWLLHADAGGFLAIAKVFFLHSVVMPDVAVLETHTMSSVWPLLSVQNAGLGTGSVLGWPALVLWVGLLAVGLYHMVRQRERLRFRVVLAASVLGQLVLHLLYGRETFLFTPHFVPLLILIAAVGTRTKGRKVILVGAMALILCCAYNNIRQFDKASRQIQTFAATHPIESAQVQGTGQ